MKGLLLKDYFTLLKQAKIFILLIFVFAVAMGDSMTGFAVFYASMLPITALAFDERAKWDDLAAMMPYTARDIVLGKYIMGYICVIGAGVIVAITQLVRAAIDREPASPESYAALVIIVCAASVMLALNLPMMFRYGVERGRIAFLIMIAVVVFIGMTIGGKLTSALSASEVKVGAVAGVSVGVAAALNIASITLSMAFYNRRKA